MRHLDLMIRRQEESLPQIRRLEHAPIQCFLLLSIRSGGKRFGTSVRFQIRREDARDSRDEAVKVSTFDGRLSVRGGVV